MSSDFTRTGFTVVVLTALACGTALRSSPQKASFDVVSIRPNNSGARGTTTNLNGGTVVITNVTVRGLILQAYSVPDAQLVGGPDWMSTARFDIQAKVETGPIRVSDFSPMLQSMMEDRFRLKSHRESREQPVFILTVARDGHKMKAREGGQAVPGPGAIAQGAATTSGGPAGVEIVGSGIAMARLANMIAARVGRFVVDKTDLNGLYDMKLTFVPSATLESTGPSLSTALQEELGLRLDSGRGPVDVLVVDDIQPPTEN
jgi:uncharacterized protein (TIGR03435 family)